MKNYFFSTLVLLGLVLFFAFVFTGNRGEGSNIITRIINDAWTFIQSLHP